MNPKQQSHFKMFVATLGVLDLFQTTWQEIADFLAARNALAAALEDIRTGQRQQAGVTTGVTADKRQARRELCQAAALVGGAVAAWADRQDNHELFDAVDYSAADLLHQSEQTCLIHAQAILEAGTASLAAVTPGGILNPGRPDRPADQVGGVQNPAHPAAPDPGDDQGGDRCAAREAGRGRPDSGAAD